MRLRHAMLLLASVAATAITACASSGAIKAPPPPQLAGILPYHPTASNPQGGGGDGSNRSLVFMCDQRGPTGPNDFRVQHMDFWSRTPNPEEWVQYTFDGPMKVSSVSVYWWDDRDNRGGCRVPTSWRLVYLDGKDWKPVANKNPFGCERNQFNKVDFTPVATTALRIEIKQPIPNSTGVSEWKVE